jgi:hypothetical protein
MYTRPLQNSENETPKIMYVKITWTPHIYGWPGGLDAMYPGGGIGEYAYRIKELWIKIHA